MTKRLQQQFIKKLNSAQKNKKRTFRGTFIFSAVPSDTLILYVFGKIKKNKRYQPTTKTIRPCEKGQRHNRPIRDKHSQYIFFCREFCYLAKYQP